LNRDLRGDERRPEKKKTWMQAPTRGDVMVVLKLGITGRCSVEKAERGGGEREGGVSRKENDWRTRRSAKGENSLNGVAKMTLPGREGEKRKNIILTCHVKMRDTPRVRVSKESYEGYAPDRVPVHGRSELVIKGIQEPSRFFTTRKRK